MSRKTLGFVMFGGGLLLVAVSVSWDLAGVQMWIASPWAATCGILLMLGSGYMLQPIYQKK